MTEDFRVLKYMEAIGMPAVLFGSLLLIMPDPKAIPEGKTGGSG